MKKLGKLTILTTNEYESLVCRAADFERVYTDGMTREANRRAERKAAFNAGKWHSAGGYGKCLKETKAKLKDAQEQVNQYRPIGEIFQPSKELTALLEDVNGVSDVDAAADFEVVGNQVRLAKAKL